MKALKQEAGEQFLVEAAQRDPRRFAELYELNFDHVYAYIARRVQTREEAEDLTSEVFHHALAKLNQFEWRGTPFAAWLFRIAANAIADRWERMSRQPIDRQPIDRQPIDRQPGHPAPDELEDGNTRSGLNKNENAEQRVVLSQLVESLPADQRRVVIMRFIEQKSIREIAQEIRRSEGAVKQLQFRALGKLRALMEGADA